MTRLDVITRHSVRGDADSLPSLYGYIFSLKVIIYEQAAAAAVAANMHLLQDSSCCCCLYLFSWQLYI